MVVTVACKVRAQGSASALWPPSREGCTFLERQVVIQITKGVKIYKLRYFITTRHFTLRGDLSKQQQPQELATEHSPKWKRNGAGLQSALCLSTLSKPGCSAAWAHLGRLDEQPLKHHGAHQPLHLRLAARTPPQHPWTSINVPRDAGQGYICLCS